jgi:hypothetical protein
MLTPRNRDTEANILSPPAGNNNLSISVADILDVSTSYTFIGFGEIYV